MKVRTCLAKAAGAFLFVLMVSFNAQVAHAATDSLSWTEVTAAGVKSWQSIAVSANGSVLVAVVNSGYIYVSSDGGANWTEHTDVGSRAWQSVTVSDDGLYMAASAQNSFVYTSNDGGDTWTDRTTTLDLGLGVFEFAIVKYSADGSTLLLAPPGQPLQSSSDHGGTWDVLTDSGSLGWTGIALSSDGEDMAAVANEDDIYISHDTGATWTAVGMDPLRWEDVGMSADGTTIAAVDFATVGGKVHISYDSGATWSAQNPGNNGGWLSIDMSEDGTVMAMSNHYTTQLFLTSDSGSTWRAMEGGTVYSQGTAFAFVNDGLQLFVTGKESDAASNVVRSVEFDFTQPVISNVVVTPEVNGATITWDTDYETDGQVDHGLDEEYGNSANDVESGWVGSHTANLESLSCATTYHYQISSRSEAGVLATTSDATFVTDDCPPGLFDWQDVVTGTAADGLGFSQASMSSNGNVIFASEGTMWRSTDGGDTWTHIIPDAGEEGSWTSPVVISADGSVVVATNEGVTGGIWISVDGGIVWENATLGSDFEGDFFIDIAVSSNGQIIVGYNDRLGDVVISTDQGATWNNVTIGKNAEGVSGDFIGASADAEVIAIADDNNSDLWVSTDGGETWTDAVAGTDLATLGYRNVAVSGDGSIIVASEVTSGNIVLSSDSGATFSDVTVGTDAEGLSWNYTVLSFDGGLIAASDETNGDVWVSTDVGVTWTNVTLNTDAQGSANGMGLAVTPNDFLLFDNVYFGTPTTPTLSSIASTPSASGATITWTSDLESSTKVSYGTSDSYGSVTSEADTGTRVTSHSATLSGLTACTTYHYAVTSRTIVTGAATSTDATFTTTCTEEEQPRSRSRSGVSIQSSSVPASTGTAPDRLTPAQTQSIVDVLKSFGADAAVIANVTAALARSAAPTPPGTFTRNLELNTAGEDVRTLQRYLNTHGFPIAGAGPGAPGNETTIFGTLTYQALVRFQRANNLPPTGYFGPMTRELIGKL